MIRQMHRLSVNRKKSAEMHRAHVVPGKNTNIAVADKQ